MNRISLWLIILAVSVSCIHDLESGQHNVFYIPEGEHQSNNKLIRYDQDILTFAFRFDNSAIYELNDLNQYDTNKLFGFKYGLDPHINSARFGWRWSVENRHIEINAYTYVDGIRDIYEVIGYCFPNEIYSAEIEETDVAFIYRFQGNEYQISKTKNSGDKYYLFPYFGGDKKAPHQISIELWF